MLLLVCRVESLRAIAETFHAAKKLNDEDVLIVDTKLDKYELCSLFCISVSFCLRPVWGRGTPLPPLSIYFLIFSSFYFFLSFIGFTYSLLLSIPSLSTRIVPLHFQAGGRRRRPNLGLVCFFCVICVICIP